MRRPIFLREGVTSNEALHRDETEDDSLAAWHPAHVVDPRGLPKPRNLVDPGETWQSFTVEIATRRFDLVRVESIVPRLG